MMTFLQTVINRDFEGLMHHSWGEHLQFGATTLFLAMLLMTTLKRVQGSASFSPSPVGMKGGAGQAGARSLSGTNLRTRPTFFSEMDRMRELRDRKLFIVSDFDRTITTYLGKDRSGKGEECHDIIFNHADKSPEWMQRIERLWTDTRERFGPYTEMTEEVREKFCNWWWSEANDIIHRRGLTRDDIRRAAHMSDTVLRPGFAELVKQCSDKGVPFVIVSAGFADVIEGILEREGIDTSQCVVHANRMKFDDRGIVVGFEGQMVHSRNKAEFSKYVPPHLEPEMLQEGTRMIVMGDKINDLDAVDNFRHHASLKVGFATSEGNEDELLEGYDIVVPGDGPMHHVSTILEDLV